MNPAAPIPPAKPIPPAAPHIQAAARRIFNGKKFATNVECLRVLYSLDMDAAGFARMFGGDVSMGQGAMSHATYAEVRAVQIEVEELRARRDMLADHWA
ncbi:hypothetical protein [Ancylobacter polymorphus]|uniref:Uncharacterized protein n=1 Tax=Ancylobacter polymorphus TaxID=223390 RepID=A0ABU0B7N2_9HYPH|nr:hypothetical protein [Ancylobacter polymorphus]MDQ0301376.1 hypothetical protein [Ancylobacter polymorphus]